MTIDLQNWAYLHSVGWSNLEPGIDAVMSMEAIAKVLCSPLTCPPTPVQATSKGECADLELKQAVKFSLPSIPERSLSLPPTVKWSVAPPGLGVLVKPQTMKRRSCSGFHSTKRNLHVWTLCPPGTSGSARRISILAAS